MLSIIFAVETEKLHLCVCIRYRLNVLDTDSIRMRNISTHIITRFDRNTHRRCKGKVVFSLLAPKTFILLSVEIKLH
jgi:hypothetical protein